MTCRRSYAMSGCGTLHQCALCATKVCRLNPAGRTRSGHAESCPPGLLRPLTHQIFGQERGTPSSAPHSDALGLSRETGRAPFARTRQLTSQACGREVRAFDRPVRLPSGAGSPVLPGPRQTPCPLRPCHPIRPRPAPSPPAVYSPWRPVGAPRWCRGLRRPDRPNHQLQDRQFRHRPGHRRQFVEPGRW